MKVAMVSEHASPLAVLGGVDAGGQNVHVAGVATAMARHGVDVVVYTRRDDPALPERVQLAPRVTVEHIDAGPPWPVPKDELLPFMDRFADALRAAWEADRPHIAHAHFWMSGRAALAAGRALEVPVVQTFHALGVVKRRHQGDADTSPPERHEEERAIVRGADGIVATCSDEVFELVRLGADLRQISVVPCGVDLALFTPDGPAEPRGAASHRLVVVTRLVERKGIGNVITALAQIPDADLVVAGGPERAALRNDPEARRLLALARTTGVADRVELRGRVERDRLPALLRSADVVVCVPWYEPFGIVPLEAMACGVPVVASSVGGLIDTVVDGVTGLHVPPRRPDRVADAVGRLLDDPSLRATLGENGVERARGRYSWDRIAEGTLRAYENVLRRHALLGSEVRR